MKAIQRMLGWRRCRSAVVVLVASTAPPSAFADGETFEFRISNILSPEQPMATIELWAHFDARDYAFASAELDILATEPGWSDPRVIFREPGARAGVVSGSAVEDLLVWQSQWPLQADPTNPLHVWSARFTATDFAPRRIELSTMTSDFRVYMEPFIPLTASRISTFAEGEGAIVVVPATGALTLLGAAGLAFAQRRRS